MATSQNPDTPRSRPPVGDRSGTGAANPPGADPTPASTTEHDTNAHHANENSSGHANVRGTLPIAGPSPTSTGVVQPPPPVEDDDSAPRHHRAATDDRAATAVRDVDDPDIDAALDAVVDTAPPLPYEVRARLAWLLQGQHHQPRRDKAA